MTDKDIADKVYIEPLTVEVVEQLILKEKSGQCAAHPGRTGRTEPGHGAGRAVDSYGKTACASSEPLLRPSRRQKTVWNLRDTMEKIGEPVAPSLVVENVEDGVAFANKIGYPVVLRPAYTLGGSGGGIAHNPEELEEILENGLRLSRVGQVLVERCIAGWKEIEYEVMRDGAGNVITVCNMENYRPGRRSHRR